jgi:hypothetical protein
MLVLAGLCSALVTIMAALGGVNVLKIAVGLIFSLVLTIYFAVYEGHRNLAKIAVFIGVCTAAFPISMRLAFWLFGHASVEGAGGTAGLDVPAWVFLGAGFVGAFLVLGAGRFAFGPRNVNRVSAVRVILWSIGGGLLGVVGSGEDPRSLFLLLLFWQPGIALLLGLLLVQERKQEWQKTYS